ncbi:MAG: D-alanyl-D-alanine carboxypeptidase [Thermomicrobiales bacterium]|nr:D-alanyl-D-alanine carboxypeptidase [Thermomicrobiales bacterium]
MSRLALAAIAAIASLMLAIVAQPVSATTNLVARNAIVIDASSGEVLYQHNADAQVPPASLTKIFTAIAAIEITPLDRQMTATSGDLVGEASMGLVAGESDSFQTLLAGMLLSSGNDAAMTIARNLAAENTPVETASVTPFVDYTNARIAELGATSTHLVNPHGLDTEGHVTTARDLATIARYGLQSLPAFGQALNQTAYTGDGHTLYTTNPLSGTYPGLIGGKTGITQNAGYCLVEIAQRNGQSIIAVLLGSTADAWASDATALLDYGFTALAAPAQPTAPDPSGSAANSQLSVIGNGAEQVVTSAAVERQKSRAPGAWAAMALAAIPCLLLIGFIVNRATNPAPMKTRRTRAQPTTHRRPRPRPASAFAPHGMTAPFVTYDSSPSPTHQQRRVPEPSAVPSFGD